jgi:hypothetical protein
MPARKADHLFAMAIDRFYAASQGRNMTENLAIGLRDFIEGMKRREPEPPDPKFGMAIDHCDQAADEDLQSVIRMGHLATALQLFIAAMR